MTVLGINTVALMMLLRVYAMYDKNRAVVGFVAVVFCLELGTNVWLLTYGIGEPNENLRVVMIDVLIPLGSAVRHSRGVHGM